jgi:hypothetical protein
LTGGRPREREREREREHRRDRRRTEDLKSIRFPLLDEEGEITAVGGISVDITAERAAVQLRDELTATNGTRSKNCSYRARRRSRG